MATDVYAASRGKSRLTGAASGVVLSTTAAFTPLIKGTKFVDLVPRNFTTAVVMRYIECPYLAVLTTHNALAAVVDISDQLQDGSTSVTGVLSSLPTLANGGALWVGSPSELRGVHIDVNAVNGTANNLTVHYWNGSALTDISDTDNTDTGASLAQDGTVTWTAPTNIVSATLEKITGKAGFRHDRVTFFWYRFTWNAAMDAATTLNHILGINSSTAYDEVPAGLGQGFRVEHGQPGRVAVGGFETLVDAGSGNVLISCSTLDGRFSTGEVIG